MERVLRNILSYYVSRVAKLAESKQNFLAAPVAKTRNSVSENKESRNTMQTAATNITHELRMVWNNNLNFLDVSHVA